MPAQTTKKNVRLADGCLISIKAEESSEFLDVGVIQGDYNATLQYDEEEIEFGNGTSIKTKRNMRMEGSFVLANLDNDVLEELSNGVISKVATAGSEVLSAAFDEQLVSGFTPNVPVDLSAVVNATGTAIKFSAAPVITSIFDNSVTPVELTADDDYFIIADNRSASGYRVMFTDEGTGSIATTAVLTITFGNNTPVASETLYCGTTSFTSEPYAMRVTHTNSSSVVDYQLDLYNVYTSPGSYNFGLKGTDTGGVDTMEISFSTELDETKTDGRQLFALTRTV